VKKFKLALLAAALAGGSLAMAQDKAALIQQIIDLQRPSVEALARNLVTQSSAQIAADGSRYLQTQVPPEKREAAFKAANVELKGYFDEAYPIVRDKALQLTPATMGSVLEQNFNEEELKQLLAWINSSLNKKFQEVNPKLWDALTEKLVADTRATIEPKLVALDERVAKALGAPTNPPGAAAPAKRQPPAKAPATQ
jgi:hypothetical protein